jgi:hypothetical protein
MDDGFPISKNKSSKSIQPATAAQIESMGHCGTNLRSAIPEQYQRIWERFPPPTVEKHAGPTVGVLHRAPSPVPPRLTARFRSKACGGSGPLDPVQAHRRCPKSEWTGELRAYAATPVCEQPHPCLPCEPPQPALRPHHATALGHLVKVGAARKPPCDGARALRRALALSKICRARRHEVGWCLRSQLEQPLRPARQQPVLVRCG